MTKEMTREEYFQELQNLSERIIQLTAIRNQAIADCIAHHFANWPAMNAAYLRWEGNVGEYQEHQANSH